MPVPSAPLLAAALRRAGLTVHVGPRSADARAGRARRRRCSPPAASRPAPGGGGMQPAGALAVDTESAWLAPDPACPFAVVRAVVDTPDHPLVHPGTVRRGLRRADAHCAAPRRRSPPWCAARRGARGGARRAALVLRRAWSGRSRPSSRPWTATAPRSTSAARSCTTAHVVADLERRGAVFVEEVDEVPAGAALVLAAHGVAPSVRRTAASRDLAVVDATCPLVTKVHAEVRRARRPRRHGVPHRPRRARGGRGHRRGGAGARRRRGQRGRRRDRRRADPAGSRTRCRPRSPSTRPSEVAAVLRAPVPGAGAPRTDDICYATTNRQDAVRAMAAEADLVLVVGSANSSNSVRLVGGRRPRRGPRPPASTTPGRARPAPGSPAPGASASPPARRLPPTWSTEIGSVVDLLRGLGPVTVAPGPPRPRTSASPSPRR